MMEGNVANESGKPLLLAPGPVPIPEFVAAALSQPVIHHRTAAFQRLYAQLQAGLRYLFQTQQATGVMIGSGTYGVETGMYSLFQPGDRVVVVDNGKFSARWVEYAEVLQLDLLHHRLEWGQVPETARLVELAKEAVGVVITHCETSTGALTDLEEIALALREAAPDILILVDGITSVGALPFYFDAWGIDAVVVASQKALMNPAGLIAWAISERAQAHLRPTRPGDYANWYNYWQAGQQHSFPYTPPVQMLYGLQAALNYVAELTLPSLWNQVHRSSRRFKQGLKDLGATVRSQSPSDSLTAFHWEGKDMQALRKHLLQAGYELAGGQGPWKGDILRMSHMGTSASEALVEEVLSALRRFSPPTPAAAPE